MIEQRQRPHILLMVPLAMLCTLVAVVFGRLAYGILLPTMQADLGLSYTAAANLGTVTATGYLVLLLYAGIFAGRHGGRNAILLGLSLSLLGFLGLSQFQHYPLLLICMAILGFGTAFTFTPLVSLLGAWYPESRGAVIGFAGSGVGLGIVLCGALLPSLMAALGNQAWRLAWLVFALIALLAIVLVAVLLRDPPRHGSPEPVRSGMGNIYRNPHVRLMAVIYGIVGVTYIVQTLFMYSFALDAGVNGLLAGRLVAMMGMVSIIAGPAWGWTADRLGHANALVTCMLVTAAGTLLPVIWMQTPAFVIHYLVMGFSMSGLFTTILAAATTTVKATQAAMAVSFVTLFFALGQLIGPALAGLLIDWQQSFRSTFIISALLLLAGAVASAISARHQSAASSR